MCVEKLYENSYIQILSTRKKTRSLKCGVCVYIKKYIYIFIIFFIFHVIAVFVSRTLFCNSKRLLIIPIHDLTLGQETYLLQKWWPLKNNVHLWRHLGGLYIQGSSSAGTAVSSLVAHQTTSIHQHKSAQRGANCIRRPSPFLSGQSACVWGRVWRGEEREEDWQEVWDVWEVGRVWRCVVGAGQAHKPSGRRPLCHLCHLCSCWQRLQPPSHTQIHGKRQARFP